MLEVVLDADGLQKQNAIKLSQHKVQWNELGPSDFFQYMKGLVMGCW